MSASRERGALSAGPLPGARKRTAPVTTARCVPHTGSERASASGAEGSQLREACAINSSLSALSSVISRLTEAQRLRRESAVHIPYRDSRLTFLLRVRSEYPCISCVWPTLKVSSTAAGYCTGKGGMTRLLCPQQ